MKREVAISLALEAAAELDRLGGISQSVAGAVPAVIRPERQAAYIEQYEGEARRWRQLAQAVRECVRARP